MLGIADGRTISSRCAAGRARCASSGFHHERLKASPRVKRVAAPSLQLLVKQAETEHEFWQAASLRAKSFYAYPAGREFAGQIHQRNKAAETFAALQQQTKAQQHVRQPSWACLVALHEESEDPDLVGTLELTATSGLPGEVLIGSGRRPAYLSAVCVDPSARRQGVGDKLIAAARGLAEEWGVDGLYVHMQAANESALAFYTKSGFVLDKQESSNHAHFRGQCLDGISGAGRTLLLRDTRLPIASAVA